LKILEENRRITYRKGKEKDRQKNKGGGRGER
jgi:hypothetical protein